ncbi:hypothetical protein XBFFL1_2710001 [Xenorhabdus bovienii str. feltiae Florida]|nr:hypothetical protein XBFFR1_240001 [Xenorhabdus bovienii str. feltiae France]CDG93805.1 hypothetical protein XBFFL1_2710001 [Xenorhabdus bovienii str. feltiae Florida]
MNRTIHIGIDLGKHFSTGIVRIKTEKRFIVRKCPYQAP